MTFSTLHLQKKQFRFLIFFFVFVAACSKREQAAQVAQSSAPPPASSAAPTAVLIDEEPSEQVLRDLMFRQYAAMDAQGGLPVTVTASGKSGTIRAKLYEVRKDKCKQRQVGPPGVYECGVNLMVDMWWDGRSEPGEPAADSKSISVIRDANGVWIDCAYNSDWNGICAKGIKQ